MTAVESANLERVKEELELALGDCTGAPSYVVCKIVLNVLDTAQKEKRLTGKERMQALDWLEEVYGYSF